MSSFSTTPETSSSSSSSLTLSPSNVRVRTDEYRRSYLRFYARIHAQLGQNGTDAFLTTLRLFCARSGALTPEEVDEIVQLKQRALRRHPPAQPPQPHEALDDAFRAVIVTSCAPARAAKYLHVINQVCRTLAKVLRQRAAEWFRAGMAKMNEQIVKNHFARVTTAAAKRVAAHRHTRLL